MEYFIGIVPPAVYVQRVSELQRRRKTNRLPDFVEPHVTIKAQAGLTDDLRWLEGVQAVCAGTASFDLEIGAPGWFGESVLFLSVQSEDFFPLHHALLERVNPSEDVRKRYFEGDAFHAHLTLGVVGQGVTFAELQEMERLAESELLPVRHSVWSFCACTSMMGRQRAGIGK